VSDDYITSQEMMSKQRLASAFNTTTRSIPQVGITLVDNISLPRFEFEVRNHPLKDLINKAKLKEFQKQINLGTWDPTPRDPDPNKPIIGTLWVYTAKPDKDGYLERITARLALRGDQQKIDMKKEDAYSPVMSITSFKILLSMHCADPSVHYRQLDVVGAFLTAFMKREVFIRMPKGFGINSW
jgi:hypothetical protein